MAKLIKTVVFLAILAVGIGLVVHYSGSTQDSGVTTTQPAASADKKDKAAKDKPELQEPYGVAPVGGGE